jgi:hypothetical protein
MNRILLLTILILQVNQVLAQTSVFVRNSTWQDFAVEAGQSGTITMDQSEWAGGDPVVRGWLETPGQEVLTVNRTNTAVPEGDTAFFDIGLIGASDAITIKLRIIGIAGGTQLSYSIEGNGFAEPWFDDGDFHEVQTTLAGKSVVIKFKPDNDDSALGRDIRFAIHDLPVYEIAETDFQNPNVLNALFYNVQMITFGVSGMAQANERGALLPAQISEFQDVVVFSEVFDDAAREDHFVPAMEAAGFPYRTAILNEPSGIIPFPVNGGVMTFSRWPIEVEAEIDFEECGQAAQDCLSNKGIKYARINKLGKRYHIFGTHMDAGSAEDDIFARRTQMAEMREFIANVNIPAHEPVIFGGDFNTDPVDGNNDYQAFLDSINPILPQHIGFWESNFNDGFGDIIDHAWGDRTHLVPTSATNEVITVRSLDPVLWDISEFSDHRAVLGRFTYPDISKVGGDTLICPGEDLTLAVNTDHAVTFQWFKDGVEVNGESGPELNFSNALESQSGSYTCLVSYDVIYGNWGDSLTALFYVDGADTVEARLHVDFGEIVIDEVLCHVGIDEATAQPWTIFPNPASETLNLSCASDFNEARLSIISSTGSILLSRVIRSSTASVDISGLAAGAYLIQLQTDETMFHKPLLVH